jgi:hypothetical protein
MTNAFSSMTNGARSAQPFADDIASLESVGRLGARGRSSSEWLSEPTIADEEQALLNQAAARIRSARSSGKQDAHEPATLETAALSEAGLWESLVAHAAKEASCTSAQLAHIGLDIGSIGLVRRTVGDASVKTLELFFRDGHQVRRPGLVIGARGGRIRYAWTGDELEPGELDPAQELSPQLRRLILRLCDLVARGYDPRVGGAS